jgi:hypothetical protein
MPATAALSAMSAAIATKSPGGALIKPRAAALSGHAKTELSPLLPAGYSYSV